MTNETLTDPPADRRARTADGQGPPTAMANFLHGLQRSPNDSHPEKQDTAPIARTGQDDQGRKARYKGTAGRNRKH